MTNSKEDEIDVTATIANLMAKRCFVHISPAHPAGVSIAITSGSQILSVMASAEGDEYSVKVSAVSVREALENACRQAAAKGWLA